MINHEALIATLGVENNIRQLSVINSGELAFSRKLHNPSRHAISMTAFGDERQFRGARMDCSKLIFGPFSIEVRVDYSWASRN